MNSVRIPLILVAVLLVSGCPKRSTVEGVYRNDNSSIVLELKSGGQASLAIMGETRACTYTVDRSQITLDCKEADRLVLTVQADGSLAGPPGSLIGALRKAN